MNTTRLWLMGGALAIVAVLAGGWFLGAQPFLAQADSADEQRRSVEQANTMHEARLAELAAESARIADLRSELATLTRAVPEGADTSVLVGELAAAAAEAGVTVTTVVAGQATLLSDSAPAPAAGPAQSETPAEGAETVTGMATEPVPVPEIPGMVALPVQISANGGQDALQDFVGRVQKLGRLITVSSITLTEDRSAGGFTLNLAGAIYVLPSA